MQPPRPTAITPNALLQCTTTALIYNIIHLTYENINLLHCHQLYYIIVYSSKIRSVQTKDILCNQWNTHWNNMKAFLPAPYSTILVKPDLGYYIKLGVLRNDEFSYISHIFKRYIVRQTEIICSSSLIWQKYVSNISASYIYLKQLQEPLLTWLSSLWSIQKIQK